MRIATRADNPFERLAMAAGQVPTPLFDTYVAFFTARAVMAGASLGIFAALAELHAAGGCRSHSARGGFARSTYGGRHSPLSFALTK